MSQFSDFGLIVRSGITESQIDELIRFSSSDSAVACYTSDPSRFLNRDKFSDWSKKGRFIYTLVDSLGKLKGIVWFGPETLPPNTQTSITTSSVPDLTFAIRVYDNARGHGLSFPFLETTYRQFIGDHPEFVKSRLWVECSLDNLPAVSTYQKFGLKQIAGPDAKNKIIMLFRPDQAS